MAILTQIFNLSFVKESALFDDFNQRVWVKACSSQPADLLSKILSCLVVLRATYALTGEILEARQLYLQTHPQIE